MKATTLDSCFFYKTDENGLIGIQVTQVDNTCGGRSQQFSSIENEKSKQFNTKPRTSKLPTKFNGLSIDRSSRWVFIIRQNDYGRTINTSQKFSVKDFQSVRGQISYISTCTRPYVSYISARLSHLSVDEPSKENISLLNRAIGKLQKPLSIRIPKLDLQSSYVARYSDAIFANNDDLTSQLGFLIFIKDKYDNAAITHYGSLKCRRITRSILGAEVYAFSHFLDYTLAIAHDMSLMIVRNIKTAMFTDSKSLFDTITKLSTVSEKRLFIDIAAIRETYTNRELSNVAHVSSNNNIANVFTQNNADDSMLQDLMSSGKLKHPISQWILPQWFFSEIQAIRKYLESQRQHP